MPKVTQETQNIVTLRFVQEEGDKGYGSCVWANFQFDLDGYRLNINSDCGNYSYSWHITPGEPFIKLMARIDSGYLLDKIADRNRVDEDATAQRLQELINEHCAMSGCITDDASARPMFDRWDCIVRGGHSPENTIDELLRCCDRYGADCFDWETICYCIETDYPPGAKKIAEIFGEFIQPKIKELLEEGEAS